MSQTACPLVLMAAVLAISIPSTATAEQNIMNVPGQAAMQEDQADIVQRTRRQAVIDSQKHTAHHRRFRIPPAHAAGTGDGYLTETESREAELERPSERQLELERGDERQRELEMPRGRGQKY